MLGISHFSYSGLVRLARSAINDTKYRSHGSGKALNPLSKVPEGEKYGCGQDYKDAIAPHLS